MALRPCSSQAKARPTPSLTTSAGPECSPRAHSRTQYPSFFPGGGAYSGDVARDLIGRVRQALGDRYTVITAVGRGGEALLFRALDKDGRKIAIKGLHPALTVSGAADRLLRQI